MKKLLSSVLVVGLLGIVGANAADNEIVLKGRVIAGAVVGFEDVSSQSLFDGTKFKDPGADLDFGDKLPGETFDTITKDIYVKTNNGTGVTVEFTDATNRGKLTNGSDTIPVSYKFMGKDYKVGETGKVEVTNTVNTGSNKVGEFEMAPSKLDAMQKAGDYSTTLSVTVALK